MLIKKIRLKNFKNFKDAELELSDMNVLVGANASGKSNFLQALKFLKDIQTLGYENAVSWQAGIEYLPNAKIGESEPTTIYMKIVPLKSGICIHNFIEVEIEREVEYELQINHNDKSIFEKIAIINRMTDSNDKTNSIEYKFEVSYDRKEASYSNSLDLGTTDYSKMTPIENAAWTDSRNYSQLSLLKNQQYFDKRILLEYSLAKNVLHIDLDLNLYHFNIEKAKGIGSLVGQVNLLSDGSNLT